MVPDLKDWSCTDVDADLESWEPEDDDVFFVLTLSIGEPGAPGADYFDVLVATPDGLKRYRQSIPRAQRDFPSIVVHPYSWDAVMKELRSRLEGCEGADWTDMVSKLRKRFLWEYEGAK